jgi:hypothetical protein
MTHSNGTHSVSNHYGDKMANDKPFSDDLDQRLLFLSVEPLLEVLAQILKRQVLQKAKNQFEILPDESNKTENNDEKVA